MGDRKNNTFKENIPSQHILVMTFNALKRKGRKGEKSRDCLRMREGGNEQKEKERKRG